MLIDVREIRGRILKILNVDYANGANDRTIGLTLNDIQYSVSPAEKDAHIQFLIDLGYVQAEEIENEKLGLHMKVLKLTPLGKNVVDGFVAADPGVKVKW
jgi:dihydroxyacetone kinase DhaKLM complex PTS-EIIA-like component DhaM